MKWITVILSLLEWSTMVRHLLLFKEDTSHFQQKCTVNSVCVVSQPFAQLTSKTLLPHSAASNPAYLGI